MTILPCMITIKTVNKIFTEYRKNMDKKKKVMTGENTNELKNHPFTNLKKEQRKTYRRFDK